jgi:hypothetical protein
VVLSSRRLLIPDLAVTTVPGVDAVSCDGADLLLAVEIISPSSRAYDGALKRQLYAEARVPFFLLVDPAATPVGDLFRVGRWCVPRVSPLRGRRTVLDPAVRRNGPVVVGSLTAGSQRAVTVVE